jgi:hypothetical protein
MTSAQLDPSQILQIGGASVPTDDMKAGGCLGIDPARLLLGVSH